MQELELIYTEGILMNLLDCKNTVKQWDISNGKMIKYYDNIYNKDYTSYSGKGIHSHLV